MFVRCISSLQWGRLSNCTRYVVFLPFEEVNKFALDTGVVRFAADNWEENLGKVQNGCCSLLNPVTVTVTHCVCLLERDCADVFLLLQHILIVSLEV